jgi:hypothetical protein
MTISCIIKTTCATFAIALSYTLAQAPNSVYADTRLPKKCTQTIDKQYLMNSMIRSVDALAEGNTPGYQQTEKLKLDNISTSALMWYKSSDGYFSLSIAHNDNDTPTQAQLRYNINTSRKEIYFTGLVPNASTIWNIVIFPNGTLVVDPTTTSPTTPEHYVQSDQFFDCLAGAKNINFDTSDYRSFDIDVNTTPLKYKLPYQDSIEFTGALFDCPANGCTTVTANVTQPPAGGSGAPQAEPANITDRDAKILSLVLATFIAYTAIKTFRWRGHE